MSLEKIFWMIGATVFTGDASLAGWRLLGFSYPDAIAIVIAIIYFTTGLIYYVVGKLNQPLAKLARKIKKWWRGTRVSRLRPVRVARVVIHKKKKRAAARLLRTIIRFGEPLAIYLISSWPDPILGVGMAIHLPALIYLSKKQNIKLLIAYLLGVVTRVLGSGVFVGALEALLHFIRSLF